MIQKNNTKIVIDCETSGLNPEKHQIIEACIATLDVNNEIVDIWSQRCEFEYKRADSTALKINGYENDRDLWNNAISQNAMGLELRNRIAGKTIIGHNVKFDMDFIVELWRVQGISKPKYDYRFIDTVVLCHYHLDFLGMSLSLDTIRKFFGWSMEGNHTATKDVHDTAKLYRKLMNAGRIHRLKWIISYLIRLSI